MLGTFHKQNRWQNVLPTHQEWTLSAHMTAVSRALSTEHNKSAVFYQNHLHYNLSAIILQKGLTLSEKRNFIRIFGNYREVLENFRHF